MILKNKKKRTFWFTLVELVVVITVLAILATVGFLALSGYSQDAKDSAIKANVRSVQTAISSESAVSGNSPRYYVIHDSWAALSGAFAYVDGAQNFLTGGVWNQTGTNYSAGNPNYAKLKLNGEKFKVGYRPTDVASAAFDSKYLAVGAFDATVGSGNKTRSVSYFQVAGITPATGTAVVSGNYPASSGSVAGLVRDSKTSSTTGALVDGANSSLPPAPAGCSAVPKTVNGRSYSVPKMTDGTTVPVTFDSPVTGGNAAYSQNFSCSNGTVATSGAETWPNVTCSADFGLNSNTCVPKSCRIQKEQVNVLSPSGDYVIDPDGTGGNPAFSAYCDMTTDGGGWTLTYYSNTTSVARSSIAASDWNVGPAVNFSRLYSMRNTKNSSGLYEFFIKDSSSVGRYTIFTQTNAYDANPVGNSYTPKSGNFYYGSVTAGSTWYGLALGNYGNTENNTYCALSTAYSGSSWWYCLQDQSPTNFGTGPWFYDTNVNPTTGYDAWAMQWVQIYQR